MKTKTISVCTQFVIAIFVIVGLSSCFKDEFEDKKATGTFKMKGFVEDQNGNKLEGVKAVSMKGVVADGKTTYTEVKSLVTGADGWVELDVIDSPISTNFKIEFSDTKTPKRFNNYTTEPIFFDAIFTGGTGWWEGTCTQDFGPIKLSPIN